jgi:acetylornithine deacetylase
VSLDEGCRLAAERAFGLDFRPLNPSVPDPAELDAAIERHAEHAVAFLERLVAAPSTVGDEDAAQDVVAEELERLGFDVRPLPIPSSIGDDPLAGVPQVAYDGRRDVLGTIGDGDGPSLLVNGHVDVVPADEAELWSSPPFAPRIVDGRLYGRGAGDMKGGFAMATLALEALLDVEPGAIRGSLAFLSVIEEECTGNGTLAAARAGVLADAVVLPEPTDLRLLLAGVGILWLDISIDGQAGHAQSADKAVNAIDAAFVVMGALRDLERDMNDRVEEAAMDGSTHPYNVNVGVLRAGDWGSSVPASAHMTVRVGHPTAWSADEAERRVREAIAVVCAGHPWLDEHPPAIRPSGFRAEGYALDPEHPLVRRVAAAHADAHGVLADVVTMPSTTDARLYLNRFDTPALCYGPRAHRIHGIDECVELDSIIDGARTLARFVADWFAGPARESAS